MTRLRTASLFSHLALGLAGACLACAEAAFLPEVQLVLGIDLLLLYYSWRQGGRIALSPWMANALGLIIVLAAGLWMVLRMQSAEASVWLHDIPLPVAIVPYLGPVLMALLLVRLYQPRGTDDFWLIQGLGLLQVALGCVLASGTLFGVLLFAYLVTSVCALTAHELHRQTLRSAPLEGEPSPEALSARTSWLLFSFRWVLGVSLLALPLFLMTPRVETSDWDPLMRFGMHRPRQTVARTGFSEEIDLKRTGLLQVDTSVAFQVTVTDHEGRPERNLSGERRWRGAVLDHYDDGVWRGKLTWPTAGARGRPQEGQPEVGPGFHLMEFKVPGKSGGLFLADPIRLGPTPGLLPIWTPGTSPTVRSRTLFFEAGGTAIALNYIPRAEYRYFQAVSRDADRDRYPAVRVAESYLAILLRGRTGELEPWTRSLLRRLSPRAGVHQAALERALNEQIPGEALPPKLWEPIAQLFCDHLARSGEYGYSLTIRRDVPTIDPVVDFLVNVKQGPCERFASALTLMLRSQGIPARIVKGYRNRGAESSPEGVYQIRQSEAHAWVEVLVATEGAGPLRFDWLLLDPTPQDGNDTSAFALARWWQLQQSGQSLWRELIVGYNAQQQATLWARLLESERFLEGLGLTLGAMGIVGLVWFVRRHRRLRQKQGRLTGIAALHARLQDVLVRYLNLEPRVNETPRELVVRAGERLAEQERGAHLAEVPARVVEWLYRVRYGGEVVGTEQLEQLTGQVAALEMALRGKS